MSQHDRAADEQAAAVLRLLEGLTARGITVTITPGQHLAQAAVDTALGALDPIGADLDQLATIRRALADGPRVCRYHGTNFELSHMAFGLPRCESCRQPYRVAQALAALKQIGAGRSAVDPEEKTDA